MVHKHKTSIVFIPRPNFGNLDAYIPIPAHLSALNDVSIGHFTILLEGSSAKCFAFSKFHSTILKEAGPCYSLSDINFSVQLFSRIIKLTVLFFIMLNVWLRSERVVTIYSNKIYTFADKVLDFIFNLFSTVVAFPSIQGHLTKGMYARLSPELLSQAFFIDARGKKKLRNAPHSKMRYYFFDSELNYLTKLYPETKFHKIGHPRLLESWPERRKEYAEPILEQELRRLGLPDVSSDYAVIIGTNPEYFWVKNGLLGYFQMLDEIIDEIKQKNREQLILISIKSKFYEKFSHQFVDAIQKWRNVHLVSVPLVVVACRAKFVVSLFESSGIFEMIYSNTPCIEYSIHSKQWIDLYGHKSVWENESGIKFVKNKSQLRKSLSVFDFVSNQGSECEVRANYLSNYQNGKATIVMDLISKDLQ